MRRLLIPTLTLAGGGGLGWWFGHYVGFMTAYFSAVFGSSLGWYCGRRWVRNLAGD